MQSATPIHYLNEPKTVQMVTLYQAKYQKRLVTLFLLSRVSICTQVFLFTAFHVSGTLKRQSRVRLRFIFPVANTAFHVQGKN